MGTGGTGDRDAVHASRLTFGEVVGITQTVRNYAGSLGLAVLGPLLLSGTRSRLTASLVEQGRSPAEATREAFRITQFHAVGRNQGSIGVPRFVRIDFAAATAQVFYLMAALMAPAALVAVLGLPRGPRSEPEDDVPAS